MSEFIDYLKKQDNLLFLGGVSDKEINDAEKNLKLKFSDDYVEFLKNYGAASFNEYELIGLCDSERLNVISVTKDAKERNNNIPDNWYVIEKLNIDNSYIWQDNTGSIYESYENGKPEKIANSLLDYYQYLEN